MHPDELARDVSMGDAGRPTDGGRRLFRWLMGPLVETMWSPSIEGWENLPTDRPFLLVANHSGGGLAEVASLVWLSLRHGARPRLTGMALPVFFHLWPLSWLMRALGAIPSSYAAANQALAQGCGVLVFPGGVQEAVRPFWLADQVDFCGHKGFLRIARGRGVPIVPMGIQGSHLTAPMLFRSRALAWVLGYRLLGVRNAAVSALGLAGAVALGHSFYTQYGWLAGLLAALLWIAFPLSILFPWLPGRIRMRIGRPIEARDLFTSSTEDELLSAYERVEGEVQKLVDLSRQAERASSST